MIDAAEQCDDGNPSDSDCCDHTFYARTGGAVCVGVGAGCSLGCDGAGACLETLSSPPALGDSLHLSCNGASGVTTLSWTGLGFASSHNVYRGAIPANGMSRLPAPFNHVCFESNDAFGDGRLVSHDASSPTHGSGYFYLASGENAYGEASLGNGSSGVPRPIPAECP